MRNIKYLLATVASVTMLYACGSKNNPDNPNPNPNPEEAVVDAPKDPKPSSTSFDRKVFLADFTGTDCMYCPAMTKSLKSVLAKSAYSKKAILTVVHTYNSDDPAYIDTNLKTVMGVKSYPTLTANLNKSSILVSNDVSDINVQQFIDGAVGNAAAVAGVAANSKLDEGKLYVRVNVKAATSDPKEFRVAVWILEDGIYGKQKNAPDESYNTHDNCVRAIVGNTTGNNFYGVTLEPSNIAAGEIGDRTFAIELSDNWIKSNLKYAVVVSVPNDNGTFEVCNADVAKVGESISYNYTK